MRSITTPTHTEDLQMMRGRVDIAGTRGYWIISPTSNWSPSCLQASDNGKTTAGTFDIANATTAQRWLILEEQEMRALADNMLAEMRTLISIKLDQVKALAEVPHTEDVEGTDAAFASTLADIEQRMATASNTSDLQALQDLLDKASFDFLANATPSDMSQPFDLSYLIVNSDMQSADGWSESPTISYSCGEFYQKSFDLYQIVPHLPAGTYQWRAQAFQRPGSSSDCVNRLVNAYIYAGAKNTRLAHITSGAQSSKLGGNESYVGGKYFPNNMQAASIYFGKGLYENFITTQLNTDDTSLRVGIRCSNMSDSYWCIFDHFRLLYFGSKTAYEVDGIMAPTTERMVTRPGIYSLDGRKLSETTTDAGQLPSGIYIIDGKKHIVK